MAASTFVAAATFFLAGAFAAAFFAGRLALFLVGDFFADALRVTAFLAGRFAAAFFAGRLVAAFFLAATFYSLISVLVETLCLPY